MNVKIKHVITVVSTNIFIIVLGIILGFFLPVVLSVEMYTDYKLIMFYLPFSTIFHLGIADYILLQYVKYSKEDFEEDDVLSSLFLFTASLNLLVTLLLVIINNVFIGNPLIYKIAVFIIPLNISSMFMMMLKANKEFGKSSLIDVLKNLSKALGIIIIFAFSANNYNLILVMFLTILLFINLYMCIYYRNVVFKGKIKFKKYISSISVGFPLMLAYFISILAFGLDRIFIEYSSFTTKHQYAMYAFAYSIMTLVSSIIVSMNSLIVPYIARESEDKQKIAYTQLGKLINLLFVAAIIIIFVVPIIVKQFLPDYLDSVLIFNILLLSLGFNLHYNTKQRSYFFILKSSYANLFANLGLLAIVSLFNVVVLIFKLDYVYYAIATLFSYLLFYIIVEMFLRKKMDMELKSIADPIIYMVFITLVIISYWNDHYCISGIIYLVTLSIALYRNKDILKSVWTRYISRKV